MFFSRNEVIEKSFEYELRGVQSSKKKSSFAKRVAVYFTQDRLGKIKRIFFVMFFERIE